MLDWSDSPLKTFALPGMGADEAMYPESWDRIPGLVRCAWRPLGNDRSLGDIAETMIRHYGITAEDLIVGSSLGGMVGCEIAARLGVSDLVLVGSAVSREEIHPLAAWLHPLAQHAPIDWLRFSAASMPGEVAQMFGRSEPAFIRGMCRAVFEWKGYAPGPATRLHRIHGCHDLLIPAPAKADLFVDGGHVISMTHAEACVTFVLGVLAAKAGRSPSTLSQEP